MVKISDKEFKQLSEYIENNYGIHLKTEKKALVTGRLHNVLQEKKCSSFSEYFDAIQKDKTGKYVTELIDKITTNHTFFMRETDHFNYFRDKTLPYLANTVKDKDLRIWCAGCSSGEESTTLAMILNDYFESEKKLWDTKVLATDISDRILEKAKKGQYSNEQLATLPITWRTKYFNKINNDFSVINDKIRADIIYRKFNLMDDKFPFRKKFHVIFCRNVMIYFDMKTKTDLVNKFYDMMEPGGYLFIGHSESLSRESTKYKYVQPAVYRKE